MKYMPRLNISLFVLNCYHVCVSPLSTANIILDLLEDRYRIDSSLGVFEETNLRNAQKCKYIYIIYSFF